MKDRFSLDVFRQVRLLLAVLAAMLLATPLAATPAGATHESICLAHDDDEDPREPTEPVELCAETILAGQETGVVKIFVPEWTSLRTNFADPPSQRGIDIEGSGRVIGVVLLEDRPLGDGARLFAGRFLPSTEDRWFSFVNGFTFQSGVGYLIPPGEYLLYLIADGQPARVTLRPPGLRGEIELAPFRPVSFEVRDLTRRTPETPQTVYAAGDPGQVHGQRGIAFRGIHISGTDLVAAHYGLCIYAGEPDETPGYAPTCPGAIAGGYQIATGIPGIPPGVTTFSRSYVELTDGLPPGMWAQGAWHETAAGDVRVDAVGMWLSLEG